MPVLAAHFFSVKNLNVVVRDFIGKFKKTWNEVVQEVIKDLGLYREATRDYAAL